MKEKTRNYWQVTHNDSFVGHVTKLYNVWKAIIQRTQNPNHKNYNLYGGAGIILFKDWFYYPTFKEWAIKNGYKEGLTIDRINTKMGYSPGNCRWVTRQINLQNRNYGENHGLWFHPGKIYIRLCRNGKFYYNGSTTDLYEARKLRDELKIKLDENKE